MPLGDHLRADQHAAVGGVEAREKRPGRLVVAALARDGLAGRLRGGTGTASRRDVGVEPQDGEAVAAEHAFELVLEALGARAVAGDRCRGAGVAACRDWLAMTTVVTGDVAARAVHHERHVALRAAPHAPTGAAGQEVRPPAPVEQDDRLAALGAHLCQGVRADRMQSVWLLAHVEHLHRGQRAAVDAARQARASDLAQGLRTRRRAAEQQQRAARPGALDGHLAGVVAGVPFVLVRGVVLLVDDDQAEVLDGGEDGRARAHAHARLPGAKPLPLRIALGGP